MLKNNKYKLSAEQIAGITQKINAAAPEEKGTALVEAMAEVAAITHKDLIDDIVAQAARAQNDAEYKKDLGLRTLSEKETAFYNALKAGPEAFKQSVTASQIDFFPTSILDHTIDAIKKPSGITKLINMAPAGVKKWITGSKTGAAAWTELTAALETELSATLEALPIEVGKLYAVIVIPKAIRDLEIGYIDKYIIAILSEALEDGKVKGYLYGDGKNGPKGISKKTSEVNTNGTAKPKAKVTTVTGFSPLELADHLDTLTNNGERAVAKLYVLCNPRDQVRYVNPAMYGDTLANGYVSKAFMPVEVIADPNVNQGDAFLTVENAYDMGFSSLAVKEYKEAKAIEDCDLLIAKAYGNGRAYDDNTAIFFDPTKLSPTFPLYTRWQRHLRSLQPNPQATKPKGGRQNGRHTKSYNRDAGELSTAALHGKYRN